MAGAHYVVDTIATCFRASTTSPPASRAARSLSGLRWPTRPSRRHRGAESTGPASPTLWQRAACAWSCARRALWPARLGVLERAHTHALHERVGRALAFASFFRPSSAGPRSWAAPPSSPTPVRERGRAVLRRRAPEDVEMLRSHRDQHRRLSPGELKALSLRQRRGSGRRGLEPDSGYADPASTWKGSGARSRARRPVSRGDRGGRTVLPPARADHRSRDERGRIDAGAVVVRPPVLARGSAARWARNSRAAKGIDTVQVTRTAELTRPHAVFIDNVQGSYFRPRAAASRWSGAVPGLDSTPTGRWRCRRRRRPSRPDLDPSDPAMEGATARARLRAFDCISADRHSILGPSTAVAACSCDGIQRLRVSRSLPRSGRACQLIVDGRPDGRHRRVQPAPLRRRALARRPVPVRGSPRSHRAGARRLT